MISEYIREQKRYTKKELSEILKCSEESIIPLLRKLKEFGILKTVKASDAQKDMSDLLEEDIEVTDVAEDEDDYYYVFTFVGIVVISGRILKCYPKYLRTEKKPVEELHQILRVIEKYNSREQIIKMFNENAEGGSFNLLAVLWFLLNDFYENGVYSNTEDIIETNGSGEIFWDKTINETFALLSEKRPYYIDLQTKRRVTDEYDFFKSLHECILTQASSELKKADLLDLMDITGVDLTDKDIDDFGEKEYILYRIDNELNVQFNTRKQMLLKLLYTYIDHSGSIHDTDCFSFFGTNSYNLIWERACSDVMDNQLQVRLEDLKLPLPLSSKYNRKTRLINLIERPLWSITGKTAPDTLIPDIVSIFKTHDSYQFIIFDAKYYTARLESNHTPEGQPGIESVTKQYLYQLAYQSFIIDHGFSGTKNCFLLPTEEEYVINKGTVSMKMLSGLGLQDIEVRLLPAKMVYDHYLSDRHINIGSLGL